MSTISVCPLHSSLPHDASLNENSDKRKSKASKQARQKEREKKKESKEGRKKGRKEGSKMMVIAASDKMIR